MGIEVQADVVVAEEAPMFQRAQEVVIEEPIGLSPRAIAQQEY